MLDAFLAVMDGITVCGRIRAIAEIEQPPIIIIGLISERAVEVALASGADETLSKPLNPGLLRNRTRALLTRRQTEKRVGLMRRALDAAPAGITVLDARSSEYTVAYANPAFLELSGYSADGDHRPQPAAADGAGDRRGRDDQPARRDGGRPRPRACCSGTTARTDGPSGTTSRWRRSSTPPDT